MTAPHCPACWTWTDALLCRFDTRKLGTLVPGEVDLGYQKQCAKCDEWWPLDREFWGVQKWQAGEIVKANGRPYVRHTPGWRLWCRACHRGANRRAYVRRRDARRASAA
jgi:hypothetical protein